MHYSDVQLEKMIQQDDGDLLAAADRFQHLESCSQCQQRLAELSGDQWPDEDSLELVRQALLNEEEVEGEDDYWQGDDQETRSESRWNADSITVAIGPSGDWSEEAEARDQHKDVNTDFLETALHPELMGRLGRYDVESLIGVGGFGIVFKAHDTELRRVVALKVLAPHLMSSVAAQKRFAREAQTAAAIVHEHVIPIYDVVSNPKHCYLVMQYIAGQSLQDRVDSSGPLPVEDVLRIASQIAAGLDAAHQQGVVHRDVKPANILLEESVDRVLISDFGLARTADDANLTRSGVITGTPHYMSPEQASGAVVDDRSDLFSLGSVMYFMCTGRPPFRAPQIVAVLNRICNHAHRPISQIQPQIPAPVSDLIDRLLSKDPAKRFKSAASAKAAIGQLLSDYQSGKLAADVREAETYRRRKSQIKSVAQTSLVVAASALVFWGGAKLYHNGSGWLATSFGTSPGNTELADTEFVNPESANTASSGLATIDRVKLATTNKDAGANEEAGRLLIDGLNSKSSQRIVVQPERHFDSDKQVGVSVEFSASPPSSFRSSGSFAGGGASAGTLVGGGASASGGGGWSVLSQQAEFRVDGFSGAATGNVAAPAGLANPAAQLLSSFPQIPYRAGVKLPWDVISANRRNSAELAFSDEALWFEEVVQLQRQLQRLEIDTKKFEVEFLILEQETQTSPSEK